MLERIHALIDAVDSEPQRFPPTLIYNRPLAAVCTQEPLSVYWACSVKPSPLAR